MSSLGDTPTGNDRPLSGETPIGVDLAALVAGYPGPAILVGAGDAILSTNSLARSLFEEGDGLEGGGWWAEMALWRSGSQPEDPTASPDYQVVFKRSAGAVIVAWRAVRLGPDLALLLGRDATPEHHLRQRLLLTGKHVEVERHLRDTLTESRQRYKDLVEISSDFAWETDVHGRLIFVSPAGALGWSADRLVGSHPSDTLGADDDLPSPFETRRPVERLELWMRAADGAPAYMEVSAKPLFTPSGDWNGARGVCRNLTEQVMRAAELAQVRNRENALNRVAGALRDAGAPKDALAACARETAHALEASRCAIYALGEGQETPLLVAASGEAGDDAVPLLERALNAPGPVAVCGDEHGTLVCATRFQGATSGLVAVRRPNWSGGWNEDALLLIAGIAERIAIAYTQIAYQERLGAILNTVVDGIITIDRKGIIKTFNPAAGKIFGYEMDEVIGRDVSMLMPEPFAGEHGGHVRRGAESGAVSAVVREVSGLRKDGSTFPMEVAVGQMEITCARMFTGIVRDISDRKQAEKLKAEFISTVSHELRTPLTAIRGSLALVNAGVMGDIPDDAKELTIIAEQSCERLVRLINDILDVEKIGSGQLQLEMKDISLVEGVERAVTDNRAYSEQFSVNLQVKYLLTSARITADFDRIVQVFTNLISNACKFSPSGGEVLLTICEAEPSRVRVSVTDQGPGIPEEFRSRIFGKFAQADASDSKAKGGTGLGLNITKSLVERMNGHIWFESQLGLGTTFHVEFPLLISDDYL